MEFMQPQDVAEIMLFVVTRAGRVNINNVLFRPVEQSS
jgi:NADP-dependent 3-hydroxy acid dehydrogenase YdfG